VHTKPTARFPGKRRHQQKKQNEEAKNEVRGFLYNREEFYMLYRLKDLFSQRKT
jgi:hypothetical protein